MENVRIGNDVRINLTLKNVNGRKLQQSNIKQIRAYLINTSFKDFTNFNPCFECRRFPNDPNPFNNLHEVKPDCIGVCGEPGYHCKPWTHKCHPHFGLPHDHCGHVCCDHADGRVPFNPAFGEGPLRPNYGHPWHWDDWGHHWHPHCHCPEDTCCHEPFPFRSCNFRYMADCRFIAGNNRVQVYFPAHDQWAPGVYKVILAVVTFDAGWGCQNLHHYTLDYGEMFTLSEDGIDGDIIIDEDGPIYTDIVGIEIGSANYYIYPNSTLSLGNKDNHDTEYKIDVILENGNRLSYQDYVEYYGIDGDNGLNFEVITHPSHVVTDNEGNIRSTNVTTRLYNNILVWCKKHHDVSATFNVTIEGDTNVDYIGIIPVRPGSPMAMNTLTPSFNRNDQKFEDIWAQSNDSNIEPAQESELTIENGDGGIEVATGYTDRMYRTNNIFSSFHFMYMNANGEDKKCDCCERNNCDCECCNDIDKLNERG